MEIPGPGLYSISSWALVSTIISFFAELPAQQVTPSYRLSVLQQEHNLERGQL